MDTQTREQLLLSKLVEVNERLERRLEDLDRFQEMIEDSKSSARKKHREEKQIILDELVKLLPDNE